MPVIPRRWFAGLRARDPAAEDDPAGFGTAYGLDLSLMAAPELAEAPAPGPDARSAWMPRWVARRKPAV
jgi:hypothetical protein